jgi:hypothetical protein
MNIVPKDQRVYASCVYPVACLIMVMYVDNNGIRHNCNELLTAFESDVAADGRIDLHREGDMSSFLSVRYLNNTQTGEITADQLTVSRGRPQSALADATAQSRQNERPKWGVEGVTR